MRTDNGERWEPAIDWERRAIEAEREVAGFSAALNAANQRADNLKKRAKAAEATLQTADVCTCGHARSLHTGQLCNESTCGCDNYFDLRAWAWVRATETRADEAEREVARLREAVTAIHAVAIDNGIGALDACRHIAAITHEDGQ